MDLRKLVKLAELYSEAAKRNEYMKEYMAKRYHDKMNHVRSMLGNKCKICGNTEGPFHIDHIDASKKTMRAADVHSTADSKVQQEMKNFQLLCNPCHKQKTHDEWDYSVPKSEHGTYWQYRKYECRCDKCTLAYKAKLKEWRGKSKDKQEAEIAKMELEYKKIK
jgi:hypothetical protein